MTLLAALLAALAAALFVPGSGRAALQRLRPVPARRSRRRIPVAAAAVVPLLAGAWLVDRGRGVAVALVVAEVGVLTWWLVRRRRAARASLAHRVEVARAASLMAAQLAQGRVPAEALRSASDDTALLQPVVAALELGDDVPSALRRQSASPGCGGLGEVAAAWQVSARTGAPLARILEAVSDSLHDDRSIAQMTRTELAAPRATSRMLAFMPLVGLAMGFAFGGDPVRFLIGSAPGQVCLALGATLACAGVVWSDLLAEHAGRL